MASSGYTAMTFVANEQPTTAKWNLIGSNDASFNNGNGFEDGIIVSRHFALNAVPATAIATNAILLSAVTSATSTGTVNATPIDIPGMTATVTVPTGGRSVVVDFNITLNMASSTSSTTIAIFRDGVKIWQGNKPTGANAGYSDCFIGRFIDNAPSSGSHTYKLQISAAASTTASYPSSTSQNMMMLTLV